MFTTTYKSSYIYIYIHTYKHELCIHTYFVYMCTYMLYEYAIHTYIYTYTYIYIYMTMHPFLSVSSMGLSGLAQVAKLMQQLELQRRQLDELKATTLQQLWETFGHRGRR